MGLGLDEAGRRDPTDRERKSIGRDQVVKPPDRHKKGGWQGAVAELPNAHESANPPSRRRAESGLMRPRSMERGGNGSVSLILS